MKKVLILFGVFLLLCGCGKTTKEDVLKDFQDKVSSSKSYKITGNMEISNDEETFTYSLESYHLKDNYYKVILVNQTNNHEQIILKNGEDIYVITPALNKSFKFQSEWPNNSSQAYLLDILVSDIKNDKDASIEEMESGYVIKAKVNYPNNEELTYQKIYLNKDKNVEKVEVFNTSDLVKIKVVFENVDLKAGLSSEDFKLDEYIKEEDINDTNIDGNNGNENTNNNEEQNNPEENNQELNNNEENGSNTSENGVSQNNESDTNTCENGNCSTSNEQTGSIENIIYPLYIPSNTYLTNSEKIETTNGDRIILTFSGEKNFVLIEESCLKASIMEIIPVYGEPFMLDESIGALSANSLSWDTGNISYYLASTELSVKEMQAIANSLGNSTLVSNTK